MNKQKKRNEKTAVERLVNDLKIQQRQVMRLSQVSQMEYNTFQYEVGCKILDAHLIEPEHSLSIQKKKGYWSFFKMIWRNHERATIYFLNEKQEFDWEDYRQKMLEMVESRRTALSLQQFLSIQKKKQ